MVEQKERLAAARGVQSVHKSSTRASDLPSCWRREPAPSPRFFSAGAYRHNSILVFWIRTWFSYIQPSRSPALSCSPGERDKYRDKGSGASRNSTDSPLRGGCSHVTFHIPTSSPFPYYQILLSNPIPPQRIIRNGNAWFISKNKNPYQFQWAEFSHYK